jgi:hypothetical protein
VSRFDPFGERTALPLQRDLPVLGCTFRFTTNSHLLLALVDQAFAGLPDYSRSAPPPAFDVSLVLNPGRRVRRGGIPPPPKLQSGSGFLSGAVDAQNFAVMFPAARKAWISVTPRLLRFPHLLRYELIEFAVLTLAARCQRLVPLHGACVGRDGRGVLLLGDSGAGKTTMVLESLLAGFEYLSEDSVFVAPDSLAALAVPGFMHLRLDCARSLGGALGDSLRNAARIRRRSGERKYALDLRCTGFPVASRPLSLAALVFLSKARARGPTLLRDLDQAQAMARIRRLQPYAVGGPEWQGFECRAARLPAYELHRGHTPASGVVALRELLGARTAPAQTRGTEAPLASALP